MAIMMKYGIDLGTTNSAICKMERGEVVVKESTTRHKKTTPSCVQFKKNGRMDVGDGAYDALPNDIRNFIKTGERNVFVEFKRTMGIDTLYHSENAQRDFSSEELSAEVLKKLKSYVVDEIIDAAVITIPAKFDATQVAATKRAAELAGFKKCSLLQEPEAAIYAYGLTSGKKNGYWLVFDFGGGTFDVALASVEDGIVTMIDTDGDANLGGKNLDYAIVDSIIIPQLCKEYHIDETRKDIRESLKPYAEKAKNELSTEKTSLIETEIDGQYGCDDDGVDIWIEMEITQSMLDTALRPLFQKAVDITLGLLKRNNLKGSDLASLILVGGPTFSPILREMLREQVTSNVDTSIDPMTAVAEGAALYASTQSYESEVSEEKKDCITLTLEYKATSVLDLEMVIVKLDSSDRVKDSTLRFEVSRGDNGWHSGTKELSIIGDFVECPLLEGRPNAFIVKVTDGAGDTIPCTPNEFTIIQGTDVQNTILPFNVGIEARNPLLEKNVFVPLEGLEKKRPLPAVGKKRGLKVPHDLLPGQTDCSMRIPIYQGDFDGENKSAIHNNHVFDVVITGDDVPSLVPEGSEIDIELKVDVSQNYHIDILFVALGESFEQDIKIESKKAITYDSWLIQFEAAQRQLRRIKRGGKVAYGELEKIEKMLIDLDMRKDNENSSDDGLQHLLDDLRAAFRQMEDVEQAHEWDILEDEIRRQYDDLEKANNDFGNHFDEHVQEMRRLVDQAIRSHDLKMAHEVKHDCHALWVEAAMPGILAAYVAQYNSNFGRLPWIDKMQARQLIDYAQQLMNQNADVDEVRQVVIKIIELLPKDGGPIIDLPEIG